jgi:hypothetical protein
VHLDDFLSLPERFRLSQERLPHPILDVRRESSDLSPVGYQLPRSTVIRAVFAQPSFSSLSIAGFWVLVVGSPFDVAYRYPTPGDLDSFLGMLDPLTCAEDLNALPSAASQVNSTGRATQPLLELGEKTEWRGWFGAGPPLRFIAGRMARLSTPALEKRRGFYDETYLLDPSSPWLKSSRGPGVDGT